MEFVDVDKFVFLRGLMKNEAKFDKGYLYVPQGAGLGVEVDEDKIRKAAK
jgi:L-alanine-DL-glutamate epimerase-like enolase superfamily enzyme